MKKITAALAVLLCVGMNLRSYGVPIGSSNEEMDYLVSSKFFHDWCCGVYGEGRERDVDLPGVKKVNMVYSRVMGYVGYDVLPGFTLYATAGAGITDLDDRGAADSAFEYGAGLNLNLLDHEVLDPTMFDDRLRINGNVQVTAGSTDWSVDGGEEQTLDWQEVFASLLVSVVNDCTGDKFFAPFSISLFVGPVYSEYFGGDLEARDKFGVTAGMEIFYGLDVTLSAGIEMFNENPGYIAGLHFRF